MFAPAFDIMHLKALALQIGGAHANVVELTTGKNVAGDRDLFRPLLAKRFVGAFGGTSDGVVEVESVRREQTSHRGKISWVIVDTDVFEHADRGGLVELPVEGAVVPQL